MKASEVIDLVRRYGQERYRHGKATIRAEKAGSGRAKHRQQMKAQHHAQTAVAIKREIETAIDTLIPYSDG